MTLSEFIKHLQRIDEEAQNNKTAHPGLCGDIDFYLNYNDTMITLDLDEIVVSSAIGCGCILGAYVKFNLGEPLE